MDFWKFLKTRLKTSKTARIDPCLFQDVAGYIPRVLETRTPSAVVWDKTEDYFSVSRSEEKLSVIF